MLPLAARGILRAHGSRPLFPFKSQFTFRRQPMIHVTPIHSSFALKDLVSPLRNLITAENAATAFTHASTVAVTSLSATIARLAGGGSRPAGSLGFGSRPYFIPILRSVYPRLVVVTFSRHKF